MSHRTPLAAACLHSKQPFDQGFHIVSRRADLSSDAKVVHAYLVSLHRSGRDETQAKIAEHVGLTRHRVWSAIRELVGADLVQAIRYGLGHANGYILLGLSDEDLNGTARPETGVRPVRRQESGQSGNPARGYISLPKKTVEEPGSTGSETASRIEAPRPELGRCARCPHREHPGYYCSRCLCSTRDYMETRSYSGRDYLETRYGRLRVRDD